MLTGELPYGPAYERCHSLREFQALEYRPAMRFNSHVPVWLDGALKKAVSIRQQGRYDAYSEFEYDLEHPNLRFLPSDSAPFIERNPASFWRATAGVLAVALVGTWIWILSR